MKLIPLSAKNHCKNSGRFVAIVDDEDFEFLTRFNWMAHVKRGGAGVEYVRARRTDRSSGSSRSIDMHRVVWELANGRPVPVSQTVDHIEHGRFGGLDNRRGNLRLATRHEQQGNRRKGRLFSSKWKGVVQTAGGRWAAYARDGGRTKNLGTFISEDAAAKTYDAFAVAKFGQFAKLNFPAVPA